MPLLLLRPSSAGMGSCMAGNATRPAPTRRIRLDNQLESTHCEMSICCVVSADESPPGMNVFSGTHLRGRGEASAVRVRSHPEQGYTHWQGFRVGHRSKTTILYRSPRLHPVLTCTRTTRTFGICPSFKGHFRSPRAGAYVRFDFFRALNAQTHQRRRPRTGSRRCRLPACGWAGPSPLLEAQTRKRTPPNHGCRWACGRSTAR
jgi:hypothetical protein